MRRQQERGTDYQVVLNRLDARIAEILKEHPELDDDGLKDFMAKVQEPLGDRAYPVEINES